MGQNPFAGLEVTPEERQQLDELMAEGDNLEKEHGFHPIMRHVIHLCLEEDGETWRTELAEDRLAAVKGYLTDVHESDPKGLGKAVFDLLRVSAFLDEHKEVGKPAYQLFSIANDAVVQFDLLSTVDAVVMGDERDESAKLTGTQSLKGAPKLGEEKPEGALSLDQLGVRRKL